MHTTSLLRALLRWVLLPVALVLGLAVAQPGLSPQSPTAATPHAVAASAGDAALARNAQRAGLIQAAIAEHFQAADNRFRDTDASAADQNATLWPLSQTMAGLLTASLTSGIVPGVATAFEPYWDGSVSPSGYSASMQPPLGAGDRKFFDDNAWTGLALVQAYQATGDAALLVRARQVFEFVVSGWDDDPNHPDPGGVWWSQQMPNPRFRHRNTVSTASSAELALQLYEAGGRADPSYLDWGKRMYQWVATYLRGDNGLYGDHVDLAGVVDGGQLTYNQGTMIGAAVLLYRTTGDPAYLTQARLVADTSLATFGPDFAQPPAYNAVFFRNLLLLEAESGDGHYRHSMQAYADREWDALRDPASGEFDFVYGRNRSAEPHRLIDQAAMLQIYAALALDPAAYAELT